MQNQFLWKGRETSKPHLIDWMIVSGSKKQGGLASVGIVNKTLLFWENDDGAFHVNNLLSRLSSSRANMVLDHQILSYFQST